MFAFLREKHRSLIPKILLILLSMVRDPSAIVVRKSVLASGKIYKTALKWFSIGDITKEISDVWQQLDALKLKIRGLVQNDDIG